MSGGQQLMIGGGFGRNVNFFVSNVQDMQAAPTIAAAAVNFGPDGTITYTGNGSSGSPTWVTPATAGVGANYWIRLIVDSGPAPGGSAVGQILPLNVQQAWNWSSVGTPLKQGQCTVTIFADAAGAIGLASDSFFFNVESSN